ncbi:non-specific serine/threonine protein kinase [Paenibacillus algorifonticola]|uniref:Non-specific serine/threonine protein kinase n=1 Tax=Paenibacillus algorifonticola TaxID=684063 RepID=A0A1I2B8E4_9BACL|nr:DEAD/DEAH box helicase [Paenibacillus algorifonticola]SFE52346.1 non-specific serine/threonine protein kinase [Paenibacillus algorifonticola]
MQQESKTAVGTGRRQLIAVLLQGGQYELDWQEETLQSDSEFSGQALQDELYKLFRENPDEFLLDLALKRQKETLSESLRFLQRMGTAFVRGMARHPELEGQRDAVVLPLEKEDVQEWLAAAPYLIGSPFLDKNWIEELWGGLHRAFAARVNRHSGSMAQWFVDSGSAFQPAGRVYFHLVESKEGSEFPFSFLSTYAAEEQEAGKTRHLPLKQALVEYGENSGKLLELLSTVHRAAAQSELISELVESGDLFYPIGLTSEEAYDFLREVALYEDAGVLCRIPKWWRSKAHSLKLNVSVGEKQPSRLGADALLSFNAELWLGDEGISAEQLRQLLTEQEGLALIKGKWVEVNHKRLQQALDAYERAEKTAGGSGLSIIEAMKLHMNAERVLQVDSDKVEIEVTNGQWLETVMDRLQQPGSIEALGGAGEDFQASLRAYQERGVSWLHMMKTLGLGACLADDMGLGKTIQIIALLNYIRSVRQERALLVVPASLIGNWMREMGKFAPSLNYYVCHPSENKYIQQADALGEGIQLVLTTYGMLAKHEWLSAQAWDMLILDEAQAIKNPGTKQTKLVKQIKASYRIAMTGTPIENRLGDLWSLFDFLNKGLLGTVKEFGAFTRGLRDSSEGYGRLRQTVSPFILRRLKTDRTIITDLPDKIEMKTYAVLTKKQIVLYNKLVKELQEKLMASEGGIQRKGLVLAALMKFKQICNHPDQYLGQQVYAEPDSGKFARLREICETIYEKRERVLIFTQFKEVTEALQAFLEQIFQHKGLVLHGETPIGKRQELVEAFQGKEYVPFMVLSIKAGGVGLNLTAANHVVHFDRWWNPAVENQATDRAFRIGQQNNVIVHKFITQGTIEEKIDQIIEDKVRLSQEIVPDIQEGWITEMDNDQLLNLMKLTE